MESSSESLIALALNVSFIWHIPLLQALSLVVKVRTPMSDIRENIPEYLAHHPDQLLKINGAYEDIKRKLNVTG